MANRAYYGGRFEVTRIGRIDRPIWEYDLNSAYPAAMQYLPCPRHTRWQHFAELPQDGSLYMADIAFEHPASSPICGLPHRFKGRLKWPRAGSGVYWSAEILAARRLGMRIVSCAGGWRGYRECDCASYEWISAVYKERQRLGKGTRGYPLKLGTNGAYGKLAQRVGSASYRDLIAAGLITAIVRSWLIEAAAHDPAAIVMMATDGVYSLSELPLTVGDNLGQWECKNHAAGIFVVQPGVYWPADMSAMQRQEQKARTRGIPLEALLDKAEDFESAWLTFITEIGQLHGDRIDLSFIAGPPVIRVPITTFIGMRLALHRKDRFAAGKWLDIEKQIKFEWYHKRQFDKWQVDGNHIVTYPYDGSVRFVSEDYAAVESKMSQERRMIEEAAPDFTGWSGVDAMLSESHIGE